MSYLQFQGISDFVDIKHGYNKHTNAGKTIVLGRIRRYSLVGGGVSLVTGFRVSKAHHATPT